jgi:UDP-N-acetylmuramoyl-L-alanyl-D-glutamate--2,6-diaminopimelate ligase
MQLQDLLYGVTIKELVGRTDREINALNFDSRKVSKDDIFFAVVGTVADGHQFIEQTIQQGAGVIICENLPEIDDFTVTYIKVDNTAVALGIVDGNYF